ncbi:MAG TPA: diguanylate cyclase, partial [Defluviitaleaceae bacterium]|nr:diguanylate cyclase [Defluviitaleaceae bacterium]
CPIKDILDVDRNVTVSIGIAEYGVDGFSEEELINKADWGMYQAKSKGKNQVCSFRDYKIEYEQSQSMEDINTEQEDSKL